MLRDPRGESRLPAAPLAQSGFSFLFVLFAIVLVGLSMMGANKQWTTMMQREREAELLYRGDQYRRAIRSYVDGQPPSIPRRCPRTVDDLLKDERPPKVKHHLRSAYRDPITGGPFFAVPGKNGMKGVVSASERTTLKRDHFPPEYDQFRSATVYREWIFQYDPNAPGSAPAQPIQPVAPAPKGQAIPSQGPAPMPC